MSMTIEDTLITGTSRYVRRLEIECNTEGCSCSASLIFKSWEGILDALEVFGWYRVGNAHYCSNCCNNQERAQPMTDVTELQNDFERWLFLSVVRDLPEIELSGSPHYFANHRSGSVINYEAAEVVLYAFGESVIGVVYNPFEDKWYRVKEQPKETTDATE